MFCVKRQNTAHFLVRRDLLIRNQLVIVVEVQGLKGRARQKITARLARLVDCFVSCRRLGELVLQLINPGQIVLYVVVAALLVAGQPELACDIGAAGPGSTKVN